MKSDIKITLSKLRFFKPLFTLFGAGATLVLSCLAAGVLTWADRSVGAQLQRNSALALFLSVELKRESAADLFHAREVQARLIRATTLEMQKPSIQLIALIRPEFSPVKQLTPAIQILEGHEQVNDRDALRRSQEILERVGKAWVQPDEKPLVSIWSQDSERRIQVVRELWKTFDQSVARFIKETNAATAEIACLDSRRMATALLTAWVDYGPSARSARSKEFAEKLSDLHNKVLNVAANLPDEDQKRLNRYAENIMTRADFFSSLGSGGIAAGRKLLLADLLAQR